MLFSRSKHSPVSLPAGHEFPGFAAVGGLMTYGTSFTEAGSLSIWIISSA
jgi:hypothetical protein